MFPVRSSPIALVGKTPSGYDDNWWLNAEVLVKKTKLFTVSDGKMVLMLEPAEEGGYVVTSPFDPELVTEAETIEEAFEMAQDAAEGLWRVRTNRDLNA